MNWFPVLLVIHIALAVALLLPSVLLPFVLRRSDGEPGAATRALMAMQGTGTLVIAAGLALTGAAMLLILGPELITQPRSAGRTCGASSASADTAPTMRPGAGARARSATWRTAWRGSSASSAS
jgi:hypothetical protein